jgi:hypothetical protein
MRTRRFLRKKLTPTQLQEEEKADKAALFASVLIKGIADEFRHVSSLADLNPLKMLIDEDLVSALRMSEIHHANYIHSLKHKEKKTK